MTSLYELYFSNIFFRLKRRSRERNFQKAERGATAAEYIGIVSIMIVLLMAAFPAFSGAISALLTSVIESFQNFLASV